LYSQKKTNSKLSNAEVPSFEKNKATIDVLNDFLHANQAADLRADEEMKIMKRLQDEYQCEGERLSSILNAIGLDSNLKHTDSMFKLAETVTSAIQQLLVNSYTPDIDETDQNLLCSPVNFTETLQRLQNLEKVRDSLNQMSINENQEQTCKKKETEFLSKKANEYAGHVRHAEKKLELAEFRANIRHGHLEKQANELTTARERLAQIRNKLNVYSDLTPDVNLARIQVQQLKDELKLLETQITDNISNINSM